MAKEKDGTKEIRDTEEYDPLDELQRLAVEHGLALEKYAHVSELLAALDPGRDMPEAPYQAVAEILDLVRECEKKLTTSEHPAPDRPDNDPNP